MKTTFTRTEARQIIDDSFDPDFMEEEDRLDTASMTDEELEEELCSSGYVHDDDFGGIVDG